MSSKRAQKAMPPAVALSLSAYHRVRLALRRGARRAAGRKKRERE